MKDTSTHNRDDSPEGPESSSNQTEVSYSSRQGRMYLKGLRAWARVAVRSYVNRHRPPSGTPVTTDDSQDNEESSHPSGPQTA